MSDALTELRAKYAKLADEANAKDETAPKVFHIFTRAAYVPEPTKAKRVRAPKTDKQAIDALTGLLDDYKSGILHGCCLISWNTQEKRLEQHVILPPGRGENEAALMFSGGAMMLNQALQDVAEFGMNDMTNEDEVILLDGPEPVA